ncbi:MAG: hypothetical protein IGQ88_02115 [Gloeomargaritaceae cyanobacterium C42_A2020_066]|nr:hypothetical protein [Gloeomargaritaceae cyanobacterium C42_A2020_066]
MIGRLQQSHLRIEVPATQAQLQDCLVRPAGLRPWFWLPIPAHLSDPFDLGQTLTSWLGPIPIQAQVDQVGPGHIRFLFSGAVDGFQALTCGEGWIQSQLEGVSLLPLGVAQTLSLLRLRQSFTTAAPITADPSAT